MVCQEEFKTYLFFVTEDPADNLTLFIPTIELHIAHLKKAHLLGSAIPAIIQNKWEEGIDLADIGKFLQAWAPEPYRDKSMECYKHSWEQRSPIRVGHQQTYLNASSGMWQPRITRSTSYGNSTTWVHQETPRDKQP